MNYYNENNKFATAWLRNLISAGLISPGVVDDRSIEDVEPKDLVGFKQCHFFAGIGVWSYALRRAGWPDDLEVWTGSCPCQPFSAIGKGDGFDDQRHLWPAWFHLIEQCRPPVIFGEQVASKDGLTWLDLVLSDLEGTDYAAAPFDLCAAGFGAPHIRQRLYFVADANGERRKRGRSGNTNPELKAPEPERRGNFDGLVYSIGPELERHAGDEYSAVRWTQSDRPTAPSGSLNGFWADGDWIYCIDNKFRPVESGTFPMAHVSPERVGRIRAYGNVIVAEVAAEFISAYMDTLKDSR